MNTWLKKLMVVSLITGFSMAQSAMASKLVDQSGNSGEFGSRSVHSANQIMKRIQPDAKVCVEGEDCGEATAPQEEVVAQRTPEEIYNASCMACHGTGVMGAPKMGDSAAWAPRIVQGTDTLYEHAIGGIRSMPPKGGCASCSDDDIKAVVDYFVSNAK